MSAENNWVCNDSELGSNILSAQYIGIIINSAIFMQLSDSWGRKPVFHITNLTFIMARLGMFLFLYDNYWGMMVATAIGSSFYPVGIRVSYTMSTSLYHGYDMH